MAAKVSNVPERPSLLRYNRPAQSSLDLFLAPEHDFPFIVCWTAANRAPTPEEWWNGYCASGNEQMRLDWLNTLLQQESACGRQALLPEEISARLSSYASSESAKARRRNSLVQGLSKLPLGSFLVRAAQRVAGLSRYTYRHSRKRLLSYAQISRLWATRTFGPDEVVTLAQEMTQEEKDLFLKLVARRRDYLEKKNAVSR